MAGHIATLTLNPAVDLASTVSEVQPIHKIRTSDEHVDPGGGGINVARVVHALGGQARAIIAAGGATGRFLTELLDEAGVPYRPISIAGRTRVSFTVREASSGQEYRFVPEGPELTEREWRAALAALAEEPAEFVVASGSLPRGVPIGVYAETARMAVAQGRRFVLDTSGAALRASLGHGIDVMKPSLRELEALVGRKLPDLPTQKVEALGLVRTGAARMVVVTLGSGGAILATETGVLHRRPLPGPVHSTVGAGDAFLASLVLALARGATPIEALDWGLAAGTAAIAGVGTARVRREDVEAGFRRLSEARPC